MDDFYNKESLLYNQDFHPDSLLKSSFDFLDVNDASAVNKILDDASVTHSHNHSRNPLRSEENSYVTEEQELENILKLAINKESGSKSSFALEPLIEPIPVHVVKGYYTLRYFKSRQYKKELISALNYYRSVQRRLTLDMLEMGTRDRIMGDCTKVMPNEIYSSAKKKALNKLNSNDLILEALEAESDMDHPVSVKSFKHKK